MAVRGQLGCEAILLAENQAKISSRAHIYSSDLCLIILTIMESEDAKLQPDSDNTPVQRFLARHVPNQLANPRKLCYRHRPDLARLRGPDEVNFSDVQKVCWIP
jgi:hypothetical protein